MMNATRRHFVRAACGAVIATLFAAGCSKAPESSSNGGAAPAPATGAIVVGEFASLAGKESVFGTSSHKGTQLAFEEINKAGGVLGRQIDHRVEDTQSKPGESATVVKKLINRDKAVAILGEVASGRSLEAAPICQAAQIPMISPSSTNPKVTETGDYIFRSCFIDPFQGTVMAKFAHDTLKAKKVALLTDVAAAYSVGLADYFKQKFLADGGEIAVEQKYSSGDKDFKAQLTAIKAAGVEAIFVPGYYTEAGLIALQSRQLGITVPLFGGDGWEAPALITIGGKAMEGNYYSTHYNPGDSTSGVQEFVKKFKARFNGEVPDAMAALGYDSAYQLVDAIKRAGSTDGPKLREALATTKDLSVVTGKITMDAARNPTKSAVIVTIKDGQFAYLQTIAP